MRFDGKVAIVTGAGGGLGREYALLLASNGASVVVNDLGGTVDGAGSDDTAAGRVVAEIVNAGGAAIPNTASVSDPDGARSIVQAAIDTFGGVDILINNAGILRDGTLHKMTPEAFDTVIDVHLRGSFYVTQPAFTHMRERGYGRIVMTTSAAGLFGNFGQVNYAAAKMGLVGMAKSVAQEGARRGVHCNVVAPVAYSRMTKDLMGEAGAALTPALVAPAVGYLAHEQCELNGEVLSVYGGRVGRVFVGETVGYRDPDITMSAVADHITAVLDRTGYVVPGSANDALASMQNT